MTLNSEFVSKRYVCTTWKNYKNNYFWKLHTIIYNKNNFSGWETVMPNVLNVTVFVSYEKKRNVNMNKNQI